MTMTDRRDSLIYNPGYGPLWHCRDWATEDAGHDSRKDFGGNTAAVVSFACDVSWVCMASPVSRFGQFLAGDH